MSLESKGFYRMEEILCPSRGQRKADCYSKWGRDPPRMQGMLQEILQGFHSQSTKKQMIIAKYNAFYVPVNTLGT